MKAYTILSMLPYQIVDTKSLDENFQPEMGCFECLKMKSKRRGKINHGQVGSGFHSPITNAKKYGQSKETISSRETSASTTRDNDKNNNTDIDSIDSGSSGGIEIQQNGVAHKSAQNQNGAANHRAMKRKDKRSSGTLVSQEMLNAGTLGGMFGSVSSTRLLQTVIDDKRAVEEDIYKNFDFPFENLILEGGGNKGMAYVGALQVLEDAGITQRIKRVAGASVGAITAALFAVGFNAAELKEFMSADLKAVLMDHKCGYFSLLPNLLSGYGWNPGKKLYKWFGDQLRERTGNAEITFRQVFEMYGRELCIVVTNLSQMSTEYFHPKTTPNTPIRMAVRMSAALPGVFQSVRYRLSEDISDVFVDGGLLCNYPIHAFDGWWLSMDSKDSFFKKLQPLENYAKLFAKSERFGTWSNKSLGIILYSDTETELMKVRLAERQGNEPPPPPNTKLYRKRRKLRIRKAAATKEHQAVVNAVGRFMKELHRMHFDNDGIVNLNELKKVFETNNSFNEAEKQILFGEKDLDEAFKELDRDDDGEITFQELMSFVESKGVNIQTRFLGYTRKEIRTLADFISTLQTALSINVKRNYVEDRDIERTIGIDTDYIEASDFHLEEPDKEFLLETGARGARAFLRHYCMVHPERQRRGSAMLTRDFFETDRIRKLFEARETESVHSLSIPAIPRNSLSVDNSPLSPRVKSVVVRSERDSEVSSPPTPRVKSVVVRSERDSEVSSPPTPRVKSVVVRSARDNEVSSPPTPRVKSVILRSERDSEARRKASDVSTISLPQSCISPKSL
ncbi:uncharacterized protein [Clytia hemisphaerica]|uniref:uncharacterized protein isoform X2 n=1 Tax=Clytia hemisphaerica TaxID=252671 RepID=UPI0034D48AA4